MTTLPAWNIKNRGYINAAGNFGPPRRNNWAFIWPKDRPKQTGWGRLGDILTGKGADIFVASNPNRRVGAADGPTRRRWTGFAGAEQDAINIIADANGWYGDLPGAARNRRQFYDFKTRRYRRTPYVGQWTDQWPQPNGRGKPNAVEVFPNFDLMHAYARPDGNLPHFDPANWGQMGQDQGPFYNPVMDGWP